MRASAGKSDSLRSWPRNTRAPEELSHRRRNPPNPPERSGSSDPRQGPPPDRPSGAPVHAHGGARTSAVIACRLIVEHEIVLHAPGQGPAAPFAWLDLLRAVVQSVSRSDRSGVTDFASYVRTSPNNPRPYRTNSADPPRDTTWPKTSTKKRRKRRAKRRA